MFIICKSFKYKFSQKLPLSQDLNSFLFPEDDAYFIISGRFLPASLLLVILIVDNSKTAVACLFLGGVIGFIIFFVRFLGQTHVLLLR